jgi:hypothetical protein
VVRDRPSALNVVTVLSRRVPSLPVVVSVETLVPSASRAMVQA